jgi:hypothetical protein
MVPGLDVVDLVVVLVVDESENADAIGIPAKAVTARNANSDTDRFIVMIEGFLFLTLLYGTGMLDSDLWYGANASKKEKFFRVFIVWIFAFKPIEFLHLKISKRSKRDPHDVSHDRFKNVRMNVGTY